MDYTLATDTSNDNDNNEDDEENESDDSNENIQAEPSGGIYVGSCYTVEVLVPQAWEHAYNTKLIITNTSDETLHNWGFIFKTDDSVTGLYNATELSAHDGTRLFKNAGYNQDIPAGGTVEVGYTAYYGDSFDVPDEFALASFERSVEMPEYRVETFVTDEWDDGALAGIVIENISDKVIEDWKLEFDSDMNISRVWDGAFVSHDGDHYIIRNADYAQNIPTGDSWTVGMEINGSISDIENVIMTEIAVTDEAQPSDETTVSENTVSENTVSENSVSENTVSENNADPDEMGYETDTDGDGIPDAYEEYFGTDRNDPDTDDDGLTDYEEIFITGTDPMVYDSVSSGVSDYDADIDGDGLSNGAELQAGLDPLNDDTDFDGLKDGEETVYGTDPLNPDTDGDGLEDGDEIKIGLDPTNPSTFGVPDGEYVIPQTLGYDSDALTAINGKETAYQLALDVKAAGYAGNMEVKESPYRYVLNNVSVIGMIPSIEYEDSLEEMTIRFKISDAYTANELGTYAAVNSELAGIKRLAIGYYSEDLRICLPIETEYNEQTNEVYTTVTNQGTYCLIDMEKWFDMLGFEPDDLAEESREGEVPWSPSFGDKISYTCFYSGNEGHGYVIAISPNGECAYSMMKLKPYEFGDVPGVHIPFASFEVSDFLYSPSMSEDEIEKLDADLDRVSKCNVNGVAVDYDDIIIDYFKNPDSIGTYTIAELYVDTVVGAELQNNKTMVADINKKSDLSNINTYAMDILHKYEIFPTNPIWIYDNVANTLSISDPDNVTYEEKICILACRTGNPNENSFAAEIVFHADWAMNHYHKLGYANAVKADLSAYEDIDIRESFFVEPQYKRRNIIIKNYYNKQIRIHGER